MKFTSRRLVLSTATLLFLSGLAGAQRQAKVREIEIPGKDSVVRLWQEGGTPFYSISLDGRKFTAPIETSYDLLLRYEEFDPRHKIADVPATLAAGPANRLYVVQYWTQGFEDLRDVVRDNGGVIHRHLANNANIVELDADEVQAVGSLPFVRSISPFHPAFKLEDALLRAVQLERTGDLTVNIVTMRRGGFQFVGPWIEARGGTLEETNPRANLFRAHIQFEDLLGLAAHDEVAWIDRYSVETPDMDIARQMHGADFIRSVAGYNGGQGTRVEVRDIGCSTSHTDLPNFIVHGTTAGTFHGTETSGIVLGKGIGSATATGSMPAAFLVIRDIDSPPPGGSRYASTQQLVDPSGPYRCVIQTNSVGSNQITFYSSVSQNMDLILFDFPRITITQSQSNTNSTRSRPEAWAKNIIACGGINHRNTLTKSDDFWGGASIGPAEDGRIKPDLASFYDNTRTTAGTNGYTNGFGGTSGATPITAGHIGYFYQMWHNQDFGNAAGGANVFQSAPMNTTAKAVAINTAQQWTFSGTNHNLTRTHQGWGHVDVQKMWNSRSNMLIVDETDVLELFDATTYYVEVGAGASELKATMVYRDPPGTTSSSQHRINDLDLIALAPNGTVWKGNRGLDANMWSLPGGKANRVDTVENIFVQNPAAGQWRITVFAAAVNQDSHVETGTTDVDYALCVSGLDSVGPSCDVASVSMRAPASNVNTLTATDPVIGQTVTFTMDTQGKQFGQLVGTALPENRLTDSGTVALVNVETQVFVSPRIPGPIAQYQTVVANDPSMCGVTIYCQARLDDGQGTPFLLTNSVDLKVGN